MGKADVNIEQMQVVVLMGGLGTRLKEYTKNCPKSMVEVEGKPFFDYQLNLMVKQGFKKFLFLVGFGGEQIEDYYGDGAELKISITYCYDGERLLGTGGAIRRAYHLLEEEFMVIYGDSFMDIDYEETIYRFALGKEEGKESLMTVLRNKNLFDKSNVLIKEGTLLLYDKHNPIPEMEYIDYGICLYLKKLWRDYEDGEAFDISKIQKEQSILGKMAVHIVTKRFYEIGSQKSLEEFSEYVKGRFLNSRPCVFLDRDGVINEIVYNENIEQLDSPLKIEEFCLLEKVEEALQIIEERGFYIFIVTNQPAAAKGKTSLRRLYDINTFFLQSMENKGIQIEDVYMCPHYGTQGKYTKELFLIKECDCRKPKPGLLKKAGEKYNIDWENSYMVGDSYTDIIAGKAAGVHTVLIGTIKCDMCRMLKENKPDYIYKDLYSFSQKLKELEEG